MDLNYSLTWSLTCFIILTLGYTILKSYFNPQSPKDDSKKNYGGIILLIYMLITLIAQIISNFSNAKAVCQGSGQPFLTIFLYTLIPYFFIFGSIILMINIKKGWLNPFSNTIGYVIAMKLFKGGKSFNTILNYYKSKSTGNTQQEGIIEKICSDKSLITNELSGENYESMMNAILPGVLDGKTNDGDEIARKSSEISKDKPNQTPSEDPETKVAPEANDVKQDDLDKAYNSLFRMVLLKDVIAECVWLLLAGCLAISVETNIITAIECDYDPATMKAIKKKAEDTHKANKKPVHMQNKVT